MNFVGAKTTSRTAASIGKAIIVNKPRSSKIVPGAALLAIVAAGIGLLVTAALASSDTAKRSTASKTELAIFSQPPALRHLARTAAAGAAKPPPGAILAAVVGETELYALHNASSAVGAGGLTDCVYHFTNGLGGAACGPTSEVEESGIVGVSVSGGVPGAPGAVLRITGLLPNGVQSIKITDRDGVTYAVHVADNVVEREDNNAATVSYGLPDGQVETTDVTELIGAIPRQPGLPGASS